MIRQRNCPFCVIRNAVLLCVATMALVRAEPVWEYTFNETGTNAPSTGTDTALLYFYTANGVGIDLHGASGSGTSGLAGDRCLDLSSATGMGSGNTGPLARHLAGNNNLNEMMSFTICGWYKSPYPTALYARLVNNSGSNWGWELSCGSDKTVALDILTPQPKETAAAPADSFNDLNKWIFFAVTYDGSDNTNNVRIYRGYLNDTEAEERPSFVCVLTNTIDKGKIVVPANNTVLALGNTVSYDRPFKGYLDNLSIYGNPSDGSSALDESAVQAVWEESTQPGTNLLLEYGFNGSGTESLSSGYYANALTLRNAADVLTDLHGPAGSGVSGKAWDRALVLTNATGMGNAGSGPIARHATDVELIDTLTSFTLMGWYKTSVPNETPGNYANFINNGQSTQGFVLQNNGGSSRALNLNVNNVSGCSTANNTYPDANKWVFFAVSYDSTLASDNARFYRGYRTQREAGGLPLLACVATNTYNAGAANPDSVKFAVGNRSDRKRPLRAFMDNIRVFGSKRDGSAALTLEEIETYRLADYPPVNGTIIIVK